MQFLESVADLRALIEVMPNPVFIKDRNHRIVLVNTAACDFVGRSREDLLADDDFELFASNDVFGFDEADDEVFATGGVVEREEQVTDGSGEVRYVITRKQSAILGGAEHLVAVVSDVTAYREAEAQSRFLRYYDSLTGLPNGALSSAHFDQAFSKRPDQCALLLIDLDRFQAVNDRYGFPAGDELLIQFGRRLLGVVRACDTVARLGGDSFSILLTEMNAGTSTDDICQRVLDVASEVFHLSDVCVQVEASIGVAPAEHDAVAPIEMKRRADVALHQAKADGRGCWCVYSDELDRRFRHRQATEADLREALVAGTGIEIYYQPLVTIASGDVMGFEALARWRHPTRGMVMPDDFIPVAEASGLIGPLGDLVLRRACMDAAAWDPPLRLSVNVSPVQFVQGDLVATVSRALEESGLDPDRLELEITEGVLIDDANGTLALLTRIREFGVKIVLDDFGSGFSSLQYLRHFPFHKVKIDKSFIADMMDNAEAVAIVEAVLSLSRILNMEVVAEGVETSDQLELLRNLGCTQAQGYLISRPMPIDNFVGSVLKDERMIGRMAAA